MADVRAIARLRRAVSRFVAAGLLATFAGGLPAAVASADGNHEPGTPPAAFDARASKQYACPMHCEGAKRYDQPGNCPVCGMMLRLVSAERYAADVRSASGPLRAGMPATLEFQLRDPAGRKVERLEIVHEKPLHLMIVSEDLSWFAHVHPIPDGHGHFRLLVTFPAGGIYVLFHDFTPPGVGMQVVPVELKVDGRRRAAVPLVVDDTRHQLVDGYDVTLTHTALALDAECALTFRLTRGGKPVTDLEPFLGAMGHLVVISADRATYVHSHPLQGNATTGPAIQFNTTFPRTGVYKAWGQFQRHGKVITVPFVFEVTVDGHRHPAPGDEGTGR